MRLVGPDDHGEPPDPANSLAVLPRAVQLGVAFIDTAEAHEPEISDVRRARDRTDSPW
jgi:aryl-alcohol dehydrogenase-like predicted oxidoreductase